ADSAAAKAGMKAHDILLEINGKVVPDDTTEFLKIMNEIKADKPVDAVVLRKGKKETLKGLSLPEAKEAKELDDFNRFGGQGKARIELPNFPGQPAGPP